MNKYLRNFERKLQQKRIEKRLNNGEKLKPIEKNKEGKNIISLLQKL